jgi:hypothetical protein
MNQSPFADDWRASLREHYMDVVRRNDQITLRTLTGVMYETGFTEAELVELRVRATIRADETPADFVPDMKVLEPTVYPAAAPEAPPTEELAATETPLDEAETQEQDENSEALGEDEDDADEPKQLTLF